MLQGQHQRQLLGHDQILQAACNPEEEQLLCSHKPLRIQSCQLSIQTSNNHLVSCTRQFRSSSELESSVAEKTLFSTIFLIDSINIMESNHPCTFPQKLTGRACFVLSKMSLNMVVYVVIHSSTSVWRRPSITAIKLLALALVGDFDDPVVRTRTLLCLFY